MDAGPRPAPPSSSSPAPSFSTPPEWAAAALVRRTKRGFVEGWNAVPPAARRRWFGVLVAGFVLVCGLMAGLVWAARSLEESGALSWERDALHWLETNWPFSLVVTLWAEIPGHSLVLWCLLGFAAGWAAWARRPLRALSLVLGYVSVKLIVLVGWLLWERPRPTIILDGLMAPGFNSFPSGHAAQTLFVYGLLASFWIRASRSRSERFLAASAVLLVEIVVMVGRLRVGAHWPSDMIAGVIIGGAWLAVVLMALRKADRSI